VKVAGNTVNRPSGTHAVVAFFLPENATPCTLPLAFRNFARTCAEALTLKEHGDKVAPELPITAETSPTFIAMTQDDPVRVETALFYALALKNAKVPCELHIYPTGGHGYGLRPSRDTVTTWPARVDDWLRARRLLEPARK